MVKDFFLKGIKENSSVRFEKTRLSNEGQNSLDKICIWSNYQSKQGSLTTKWFFLKIRESHHLKSKGLDFFVNTQK